jgi:hypothetical protein
VHQAPGDTPSRTAFFGLGPNTAASRSFFSRGQRSLVGASENRREECGPIEAVQALNPQRLDSRGIRFRHRRGSARLRV